MNVTMPTWIHGDMSPPAKKGEGRFIDKFILIRNKAAIDLII